MGLNVCQDADKRMAALQFANHVRTTNARTVREIGKLPPRDGCSVVAKLLLGADEKGPIGSLPIRRLLKAPHRMGEARIETVLRRAAVVSERPLRMLTRRQREALALEMMRSLPGARGSS
jgi:hypothetical protein